MTNHATSPLEVTPVTASAARNRRDRVVAPSVEPVASGILSLDLLGLTL